MAILDWSQCAAIESILSGCTKWSRVRLHFDRISAAVNAVTVGSYAEVYIPFNLDAKLTQ